jgi:hypothetical protein
LKPLSGWNQGEPPLRRAFLRGHEIQAEAGLFDTGAGASTGTSACGGSSGDAYLLPADLAADGGGALRDPRSANTILPQTPGAAHLKDGLAVAGIVFVNAIFPKAGRHGHAFIPAVMSGGSLPQTVMETRAIAH